MRRKIQPIGTYLSQDEDGYVIPSASREKTGPCWEAVITAATARYKAEYKASLHSVYLRGSVATGQAILGESDIDIVGLVRYRFWRDRYLVWSHPSWGEDFNAKISQELPFKIEADLVVASFNRGFLERNNALPMLLATQAVCVYGEDIRPLLPRYRPDETMMYYNGRMKYFLYNFYVGLNNLTSGAEVGRLGRMITKAMIRCGFELVMLAERRYTRDLYLCCKAFERHVPDMSRYMWSALKLYLNMTSIEQVISLASTFGSWLVAKERTIAAYHRPHFGHRVMHDLGLRRAGLLMGEER